MCVGVCVCVCVGGVLAMEKYMQWREAMRRSPGFHATRRRAASDILTRPLANRIAITTRACTQACGMDAHFGVQKNDGCQRNWDGSGYQERPVVDSQSARPYRQRGVHCRCVCIIATASRVALLVLPPRRASAAMPTTCLSAQHVSAADARLCSQLCSHVCTGRSSCH